MRYPLVNVHGVSRAGVPGGFILNVLSKQERDDS